MPAVVVQEEKEQKAVRRSDCLACPSWSGFNDLDNSTNI